MSEKLMPPRDISDACAAIANQVLAGIPIAEAVDRMSLVQKKYASIWLDASRQVSRGQQLSSMLGGVWPQAYLASLKAGEESGRVGEVCEEIDQSITMQTEAFGVLNKLIYPVVIMFSGLLVSVFFLAFVIPQLMKAIDNGRKAPSWILQIGMVMNEFIVNHWIAVLVAIGALVFVLITWISSGQAGRHIQASMLHIPYIKKDTADIFFAVWGRILALMLSAGLPIMKALPLSIPALPDPLQPAARRIVHALDQNMPLDKSVLPDQAGDVREKLSFYIVNAFRVAEQTGRLDRELARATPIMIRDARRAIERLATASNAIAMAVAGLLLVIPLGAYYTELFKTIQRVM